MVGSLTFDIWMKSLCLQVVVGIKKENSECLRQGKFYVPLFFL